MSHSLSRALGYDVALLQTLPSEARDDLTLVSAAWCWAVFVLAVPLGYACWLLTHTAALAVLVAACGFLLLLQLLRLTIAGGGIPPSASEGVARTHRPARTPLIWLSLLGLMFAQPAQLPLFHGQHAALLAEQRARLLATHSQALATSQADAIINSSADSYAQGLLDNEFLVLRLRAVWSTPERAAPYTLGYLALLLVPVLFFRAQARAALQRYERLRLVQVRHVIDDDLLRSQQARARLLGAYPSYRPRSEGPLAMRWPVDAPPEATKERS